MNDKATQKTVLFVFTAIGYYKEARPVVDYFCKQGWNVVILLGFSGREGWETEQTCRKDGYEVIIPPEDIGYGTPYKQQPDISENDAEQQALKARLFSDQKISLRQKWAKIRTSKGIIRLLALPGLLTAMLKRKAYVRDIFNKYKPACVFSGSYYSVGQIDNCIACVCRNQKIPYFCIPNSPYLGQKTLTIGRLNHLLHGMANDVIRVNYDWLNLIIGWMFKSWTYKVKDEILIFYWDPVEMVAAGITGLIVNKLWIKPSVDYDYVFVFSEYSMNLLCEDGYPEGKVIISGEPIMDEVISKMDNFEYQKKMFDYLGIKENEPFILLNIEPSAEHSYCSWEKHWENFNNLMLCISDLGIKVVLSLHPMCKFDDYAFSEEKYGVKISTRYRIHDLYPYCRISVSFPCSTNVLAEQFHKPLVIFDFFNTVDRDEDSRKLNLLPGALLAKTGEEVRVHILSLLENKISTSTITTNNIACKTIFDTAYSFINTSKTGCRNIHGFKEHHAK